MSDGPAANPGAGADVLYRLEDRPPAAQALVAALQHVSAVFVGIITPPLLIAQALGLEVRDSVHIVGMSLMVSGIATFIQARRLGPVGSGLLSIQGTSFAFLGDMSRCYLELSPCAEAFPVNCFALDGVLHVHTGRYAKLPRWSGENWAVTVRREPDVRVEHEGKVYALRAVPIEDEALRREILSGRGYWRAWDGITVVRFLPRGTSDGVR